MADVEISLKIRAALERALPESGYGPQDVALVELARRYADELDGAIDPAMVGKLGERLERALDRLNMTPAARSAVRGGAPNGQQDSPDPLEALRSGEATLTRLDYAASVDPAVAEALAG